VVDNVRLRSVARVVVVASGCGAELSSAWTLHLGDCIAGMATLADASVDHVITDPPYSARTHSGQHVGRSDGVGDLTLNYGHLTPEQVAAIAPQLRRIARGWVLIMTDHLLFPHWDAALTGYTFAPIPCVMTGMTVRLQGDGPSYWTTWLVVNRPTGFMDGTKPGAYTGPAQGRGENIVPGSKPEWLMDQILRDYSKPGELICDPYSGGGTTGLSAVKLGRRFIGWELDAKHCAFATKRLEAAREQMTIPATRSPKMKQAKLL
jgi:site-specific DNA-methyltransferase (adenine-specific)